MTQQDDGTGREERHVAEPLTVPGLNSVIARSVRYESPRRFFTNGEEHSESDVIEIDVETDAEFYIAGTGPALFVGDVPIVDSERIGDRRYRFFAPASAALEEGAPVTLGRAGSGVPVPGPRSNLRLQWSDTR
jgi:hypothetical protein